MKKFVGKVVSCKMQKTALVEVVSWRVVPLYKKRVRRKKHYPVHDTIGVQVGDVVEFFETRPISKTKRWKIAKIIESGGKNKTETKTEKSMVYEKKERKKKK